MGRPLAPAVLAALLACAAPAPRVDVTPTGRAIPLAPRAKECPIEFFRTRPPDRAYDEIAVLEVEGRTGDSPAQAQEALRREACVLGADAVVVTREDAEGRTTGVAVSYPEERDKHRAAAVARDSPISGAAALRFEEDRRVLEAQADAAGAAGPPLGFVGGRFTRATRVRIAPERRAEETGDEIPAGTPVWIAARPAAGWRQVWRPALQTCWVEEDDVERIVRPGSGGEPGAR